MPTPQVNIIILNWNGWQDTIECLESVLQSDYPSYCITVIDNGSTNDSLARIQSWAQGNIRVESQFINNVTQGKLVRVITYDRATAEKGGIPEIEEELSLLPSQKKLILIPCSENLGFAMGCNIGIQYAIATGSEYVWLLNNDTVIESTAIQKLINFMESNSDYQGATGQIRLYKNPNVIWNCGGALTFYGSRRYFHSNSQIADVPQHGFRRISFITGCASLFRTSLFKKVGLLSDLFFYGEEDFELSLRLRLVGYKLVCLYDAIIYHKVGSSINVATRERNMAMTYIFYLNRFIDMRYYWPKSLWRVWRFFYFFYIYPLLKLKYRISWGDFWLLRKILLRDSTNLDRVSKETFEQSLSFRFSKDL